MQCVHCLRIITGKPFYTSGSVAPLYLVDHVDIITGEPQIPCFCNGSCAWLFWYEALRLQGVKAKHARKALAKIPGLLPPGRKGNHPDDH